jgi:hypothetical protein
MNTKMKKITTYTEINGFHKYWGKKPLEYYKYFINELTSEGDVVLEPFLGSANVISILDDTRKFIGIDINPFSKIFADFLINLPTQAEYKEAIDLLEKALKDRINDSYRDLQNNIATHYVWEDGKISEIWVKNDGKKQVAVATKKDMEFLRKYDGYETKHLKSVTFFNNKKINVNSDMTIYDFFTKRALCNIDMLLEEINLFKNENIRRALLLTVTSAIGQMSNMVFVINRNGKREVGSWVIGFWLPKEHFEINVWNCFINKAKKLLKNLPNEHKVYSNVEIYNESCLKKMKDISSDSVKLIITDPPHSNRIPYLELSEIFNSVLGVKSDFENEIIVSNANERDKNIDKYTNDMISFFYEAKRILKMDGFLVMFYNASNKKDWSFIKKAQQDKILCYLGCATMEYSAKSVAQANRNGALTKDYMLFFSKSNEVSEPIKKVKFFNNIFTPFN